MNWKNCSCCAMSCRTVFDLDAVAKERDNLNEQMSAVGFWDRPDSAQASAKFAELSQLLSKWNQLSSGIDDVMCIKEMLEVEDDKELFQELTQSVAQLRRLGEELKIAQLLNEPYDDCDAIVTVHAGSGGLDSQDWAEMLYRMLSRWCEDKNYKTQVLDLQSDEEAGLKSVTFTVSGPHAYGYLKSETGVHRLVRISPFDTQKRRHTSFSSVEVYPQMPDDVEVEIRDEDLRIDTYRSSGAGGQHVNMTDSAVRITHLPTGIVVSCQNERSQHMNKATAMGVLKSKLYELQLQERQAELESLSGQKKESSWGNQIRSYVLQPYTLCKDHRTNEETGNVAAVLDGDLDRFIYAYLRWKK